MHNATFEVKINAINAELSKYAVEKSKGVKGKMFPIMPLLTAIAKAKGEA